MADFRGIVETVWRGRGKRARAARTLLTPFEMGYRGVVVTRGWLYDKGLFRSEEFSAPVISVGNLSVGGTGKTPVSAWIATRLAEKGAKPGIVLRGYGGDETLVHERLNPGVPVVESADRFLEVDSNRPGRRAIFERVAFPPRDEVFGADGMEQLRQSRDFQPALARRPRESCGHPEELTNNFLQQRGGVRRGSDLAEKNGRTPASCRDFRRGSPGFANLTRACSMAGMMCCRLAICSTCASSCFERSAASTRALMTVKSSSTSVPSRPLVAT